MATVEVEALFCLLTARRPPGNQAVFSESIYTFCVAVLVIDGSQTSVVNGD